MRKSWLAAACLLVAATTSASAGGVSDTDRFELWNECRPVSLVVEGLPDDATAIGLTENAIEVAVRSRLRSARLYSEDRVEAAWSYLYVNVNVVSVAFGTTVKYKKYVWDIATNIEHAATTWESGSTGTHGNDSTYIVSGVAQHVDQFLDKYLWVNLEACP